MSVASVLRPPSLTPVPTSDLCSPSTTGSARAPSATSATTAPPSYPGELPAPAAGPLTHPAALHPSRGMSNDAPPDATAWPGPGNGKARARTWEADGDEDGALRGLSRRRIRSPSRPLAGTSQPRSRVVIDLTSPREGILAGPVAGPSGHRVVVGQEQEGDDDEVVITGVKEPDISFLGVSRPGTVADPGNGTRAGPFPAGGSNPSGAASVRRLSEDIRAGLFSSATRRSSSPPPVPGPSGTNHRVHSVNNAIVIHDSPPLQVHRHPRPAPPPPPPDARVVAPSQPRPQLGGGGVLSQSGLGFAGYLRQIQNEIGTFLFGPQESAYRSSPGYILGWQTPGRPLQGMFMGQRGTNPGFNSGDYADDAALMDIFSRLEDVQPPSQTNGSAATQAADEYHHRQSHPHKLQSGFTRDIVPPDREVLTLDPDTGKLKVEKDDLKPVCAGGCGRELLCGQSSESGRRPWLLACGHVVDQQCLMEAQERARHAKAARAASRSGKGRTRGGKTRGSTRGGGRSGGGSRAERGAQRQVGAAGIGALSPDQPPTQAITLGTSSPAFPPAMNKGKSKATDLSLSSDGAAPDVTAAAREGHKPEAAAKHSWTRCPVQDCEGEGDLLARKGYKGAPWEMFV